MRKPLAAAAVSVITLSVLYSTLDTDGLLAVLAATDLRRLLLSLALLLALVLFSAFRLKLLATAAGNAITVRTAVEATCAANALNLVLPGKMGDLAKAPMLRAPASNSIVPAVNLSLYEKALDIFAILVWGAVGLAADRRMASIAVFGIAVVLVLLLITTTVPRLLHNRTRQFVGGPVGQLARVLEHWLDMVSHLTRRPHELAMLMVLTLMIWAGHFLQIALMAWSLGVAGPWAPFAAALPIVILIGAVPLTIAGIGPRDATIVLLLGPLIGPENAATLGVLFWLRYLVPGIVGLPFVRQYGRSLRALHV